MPFPERDPDSSNGNQHVLRRNANTGSNQACPLPLCYLLFFACRGTCARCCVHVSPVLVAALRNQRTVLRVLGGGLPGTYSASTGVH
jgi:hypothetical protein